MDITVNIEDGINVAAAVSVSEPVSAVIDISSGNISAAIEVIENLSSEVSATTISSEVEEA
jgi:hypothetical protein